MKDLINDTFLLAAGLYFIDKDTLLRLDHRDSYRLLKVS